MNKQAKKTSQIMTQEEKKINREKKRINDLKIELNKYYSVLNFHRICEFKDDHDKTIRNTEVAYANSKIAEIEAKF